MRTGPNPPLPERLSPTSGPTGLSCSGLKKIWRSRPQALLEAACKVAAASFGGFAFLSAAGEMVENPAWGVAEDIAEELSRSTWLAELIRFVLQKATPLRQAEIVDIFSEPPRGLPPRGALLALPVTRPGGLRGALYLVRAPGQPAFSAEDEERILPISACLEQGSLLDEGYLQAQLRLLNRVAQAAAGNLDFTPILDVALRELDRHLPMTLCAVWLVDGESHPPAEGEGQSQAVVLRLAGKSKGQETLARRTGLLPDKRLALEQTPFLPCWEDGGAIYADWAEPAPEDDAPAARGLQDATHEVTSCFATPLRAGDQTVGILQCLTSRPSGFTSEQVQLLYLVADLLGPAASNCQLYGRLRDTYETLRATQEHLIRTEKLRAVGELASGMAHDFNNSLCGVLGFVEMALMDHGLSSTSRGHLELARTCALDAAQTVRRVQDFARAHRQKTGYQLLNLNHLVKDTVELTRPKWESLERSRGLPITLELRTEARAPIMGNGAELREVLTNLVFNAVDAMPQGGTLTVTAWSEDGRVFLSVGDTGVGMSVGVRQRLFEPFFSTKGEHGNGLGLSVAFGIIQQHGGEITVESEVDEGSLFTIRLPAASLENGLGDPEHGKANSSRARAGAAAVKPAQRSLRVLVVEDEEPICRLLTTVLTTLGHQPHVVQTAGEALRDFAAHPFDLVLTDMGLPDLSGEEVARTVAERAPGVPVVLLTGWADQLHNEGKALPGVTQILGKPVTIERLAETLRTICPGP
jgi:signal transduction histidine kinase